MSTDRDNERKARSGRVRRNEAEARLRDATERLEQAAEQIAASASDRAAMALEGVANRISNRADPRRGPPRTDRVRARRLRRDRENGKIFGICAGIANFYGIEAWLVRCIAITCLIFLPSVTIIAYLGAAIVMDGKPRRTLRRPSGPADDPEATSGTPTPRDRLYGVGETFDELETRLRRMESHVTSGQYELQRELAKLARS